MEISKIPLTISNKVLEALTISLAFSFASSKLSALIIHSEKPTIAFSGVRISCDILDKKSDLARLAFSAVSLAKFKEFIIFTSGFSIVKYIRKVTKVSVAVISNNPGINF